MLREHSLYQQAQLHHRFLDNHVQAATLLLSLREDIQSQKHPRARVLGRALEREVLTLWPLLPSEAQILLQPRLSQSMQRKLPSEFQSPRWSQATGQAPCLLYDSRHQVGFVRTFCVHSTPSDSVPSLHSRFERTLGSHMRQEIQKAGELAFSALQKRFGFVGESSLLAEACYLMNGREGQDLQHDGASVGFSASLALASDWLNLVVPADLACTGAWDASGRARSVSGFEAKLEAIHREWPQVRRVALPHSMVTPRCRQLAQERGIRLLPIRTVEELIEQVFAGQFTEHTPQLFNLHIAVQNAEQSLMRDRDRRSAIELFQKLATLCEGNEEHDALRARCLWWQATCYKQLGNSEAAFEVGEQAAHLFEELFEEHRCVPEVYFRFLINHGLFHQVCFGYEEATALLQKALKGLEMFRRDRQEIARAHGALGQQLTFQGMYEQGLEHLQKAASWAKSEERPRNFNNQADLLMRWAREDNEDAQRYRQAEQILQESRQHWETVSPLLGEGERKEHELYLRVYEGKLACYSGALTESKESLQQWRDEWLRQGRTHSPMGLVDKWWGLAFLRQGFEEEAKEWLERATRNFTPQSSPASFQQTLLCSLELEKALIFWRQGKQEQCEQAVQQALKALQSYPAMRNACPEAIALLEDGQLSGDALQTWSLRLHY